MAIATGLTAAWAAMPLMSKLLTGGTLALGAGSLAGQASGGIMDYVLGGKKLGLQEQMMAGQLEGAKAGTEANRLAAAQYMDLLRSEKKESRKDKAEARRMQLIAMMMGGMQQIGQQANQAQLQSDLPLPPTSIMGLLRG